jgi:hypothetical protein
VSEIEAKNAGGLNLETLADRINEEHRRCEEALKEGLRHALRAGELLIEAKSRCAHGTWGAWLAENFEGSERTAQAYMKVAREMPQLDGAKAQRVADLSLRGALKELAPPKERTSVYALAPQSQPERFYFILREVASLCHGMVEKWNEAADTWGRDEDAPEYFVTAAQNKAAYYAMRANIMHVAIAETRWLVRLNEKLGNDIENMRDWFETMYAKGLAVCEEVVEDLERYFDLDDKALRRLRREKGGSRP